MTASAALSAHQLKTSHAVSKINWGASPFPNIPQAGKNLELSARRARYHLLLDDMKRQEVRVLCTGHHLNDQTETSVMRLNSGSSRFGLAGMRRLRRWGMGDHESYATGLGWAGSYGMQYWIARPLLDVSKDRILATCEEHQLNYVTDHSNFQPSLTFRNQIRHDLTLTAGNPSLQLRDSIQPAFRLSGAASTDALEGWVQGHMEHLISCEHEASSFLEANLTRSPPSTLFIPQQSNQLSSDTQLAVILRALRYVSPNPWGCLSSESHRRSRSLQTIISHVFGSESSSETKPFSAGSGVLWVPVVRTPNGNIRRRAANSTPESLPGWLAQRLPPPSSDRANKHAGAVTFCEDQLPGSRNHRVWPGGQYVAVHGRRKLRFLFDCRFVVQVDLDRLPDHLKTRLGAVTHVTLISNGRYSTPRISLTGDKGEHFIWDCPEQYLPPGAPVETQQDWITVEHVRTLMAL